MTPSKADVVFDAMRHPGGCQVVKHPKMSLGVRCGKQPTVASVRIRTLNGDDVYSSRMTIRVCQDCATGLERRTGKTQLIDDELIIHDK